VAPARVFFRDVVYEFGVAGLLFMTNCTISGARDANWSNTVIRALPRALPILSYRIFVELSRPLARIIGALSLYRKYGQR
jgi:hypothetical protein